MKLISNYEFGDCELRFITLDSPHLMLNFFNPHAGEYISVQFENITAFSLDADFSQAVIESIQVLGRDEISSDAFFNNRLKFMNIDPNEMPEDANFIHITPIVGAEIIIICERHRVLITHSS